MAEPPHPLIRRRQKRGIGEDGSSWLGRGGVGLWCWPSSTEFLRIFWERRSECRVGMVGGGLLILGILLNKINSINHSDLWHRQLFKRQRSSTIMLKIVSFDGLCKLEKMKVHNLTERPHESHDAIHDSNGGSSESKYHVSWYPVRYFAQDVSGSEPR